MRSAATRRVSVLVVGATLLLVGLAGPATAHGDDEEGSPEGSDLVQQAIAILINSPDDLGAAADKVDEALATADQVGVDVALLEQASEALTTEDVHTARSLLEASIGARSHLDSSDPAPIGEVDEQPSPSTEGSPAPATGDDPGTAVVIDPLDTARDLSGGDWVLLAGLILLGAIGVALSLRFGPPHDTAASET